MMKPDRILIREPENPARLYPFTLMHPAWELRVGALRLFEKLQILYPKVPLHYHGRALQLTSFLERFGTGGNAAGMSGNILVLASGVLFNAHLRNRLSNALERAEHDNESDGCVLFSMEGIFFAAWVPNHVSETHADKDDDFFADFCSPLYKHAPIVEIKGKSISYLWDALEYNAQAINEDAALIAAAPLKATQAPHSILLNPDEIFAFGSLSIDPMCVLDARKGPILIGDNVRIMAHSTIIGPCAIGDNSLIKVGAKVYGETSIGEYCKVGGELENCILQAYSNKQHEGFLGHTFLSEWVNIGADTNTSDLKNNYSHISVHFPTGNVNTGRMFLGLLCGDHSKTGINTMFTTGTVTGISANIVSGDICDKFIPSFTWGTKADGRRFQIDKALEVAGRVMSRRNRRLSKAEEVILRREYQAPYGSGQ